jgi:hypothetical protein
VNLRQLCDLIGDDLEALALPAHEQWRYAEPRLVTPEHTPLLAVYPADSDYELLSTTADYQADRAIRVAWVVDATYGAEHGGIGDQELAAAALATAETIEQRLKTYADGLADVPSTTARLKRATFRLVNGLLWRYETELVVEVLGL